ncbi:hypothetical protein GGQ80_000989 [Sphingomonas jinjuensis]|uniref:Uncharacterized protein n=1 Tax=Sphingomonas jinjuensis TaxID=535907 RepID=A0A840F948_9SPHN|nr:hypothetical protein [Sphingomonas jinjuensis]
MPISAKTRAGIAALAIAAAALPAIGQDRPESLLPPGFGDNQPTPTPRATGNGPASLLPPSVAASPGQPGAIVQPLPTDTPSPTPSATPTPTPMDAKALADYELPPFARRSLALVGPGGVDGGLPADAFGRADGRYLEGLMRSLDAPLPSRWMSILLRRTLASQLRTPRNVNGADFAAERAWLLLRMGESVAARAVAQSVDTGNASRKLLEVAMNTSLATGDPGGLCPLADRGRQATGERGWVMAQAMCAGLSGNATAAKSLMAQARRRRVAEGVDLRLAQKVSGAGPGGGQAVTIEWSPADTLTVWRFGLASATGVAIPAEMFATTGSQVRYWQALSPSVGDADRLPYAEAAAGQGVLSNAALVDLFGAIDEGDDVPAAASAAASDLRVAYVGGDTDARIGAIRQLWGEAAATPYARLVLTARAAARLPVGEGLEDADRLVASMLSAGLDRSAARWRGRVTQGGDAWAMIALADPDRGGRLTYNAVAGYGGTGDAALKQRLFFAGLAGLGRLTPEDAQRAAEALEVPVGASNAWTQALDRAVMAREPGTVVLLCAVGLQTPAWRGVPPATLYRITAALTAVGLDGYARMIAAEAIARA